MPGCVHGKTVSKALYLQRSTPTGFHCALHKLHRAAIMQQRLWCGAVVSPCQLALVVLLSRLEQSLCRAQA